MEFEVGDLVFSSKFDSGNLAAVERVDYEREDCYRFNRNNHLKADQEFNVWTRRDCADTPFENRFRSWFHFCVRGAVGGTTIRINVINLNQQETLYVQGMSPLWRVLPNRPEWHRVNSRPGFETVDGQFILSFFHKFVEVDDGGVTFFAFCYPWSYEESQNLLREVDDRFADSPARFPDAALEKKPNRARKEQKQALSEIPPGTIYYHREVICYSLDGLRIDLLTVSSCDGMLVEREPRLPRLFPDIETPRPHLFKAKRVYLVTSRVHPGETPSSFVFNGFLNFILDEEDPRARLLRRLFVFKLIPMLNPDGVRRGHFRTDPRGLDLNRVYLAPDLDLHPSVFASKSLVLYHHRANRLPRDVKNKILWAIRKEQELARKEEAARRFLERRKKIEKENKEEETVQDDIEKSEDRAQIEKELFVDWSRSEEERRKSIDRWKRWQREQANPAAMFVQAAQREFAPAIPKPIVPWRREEEHSDEEKEEEDGIKEKEEESSEKKEVNKFDFDTETVGNVFKLLFGGDDDEDDEKDEPEDDESIEAVIGKSGQDLLKLVLDSFDADLEDDKDDDDDDDDDEKGNQVEEGELDRMKVLKLLRDLEEAGKNSPNICDNESRDEKGETERENTNEIDTKRRAEEEQPTGLGAHVETPAAAGESSEDEPCSDEDVYSSQWTDSNDEGDDKVIEEKDDEKKDVAFRRFREILALMAGDEGDNSLARNGGEIRLSKSLPHLPTQPIPFVLLERKSLTALADADPRAEDQQEPQETEQRSVDSEDEVASVSASVASTPEPEPPLEAMPTTREGAIDVRLLRKLRAEAESLRHLELPPNIDPLLFLTTPDQPSYESATKPSTTTMAKVSNKAATTPLTVRGKQVTRTAKMPPPVRRRMVPPPVAVKSLTQTDDKLDSSVIASAATEENTNATSTDETSRPSWETTSENMTATIEDEQPSMPTEDIVTTTASTTATTTEITKTEVSTTELPKKEMASASASKTGKSTDKLPTYRTETLRGINLPHWEESLRIPADESGIAFFVDLHAHASKRGCFLFGNRLYSEEQHVDNLLFAKLMSLNTQHLDFSACNFSKRNMKARNWTPKKGCARVAYRHAIGLVHSYTLEANYNSGRMSNGVGACNGIGVPKGPPFDSMAESSFAPKYTPAHYEDVGRALAVTALDMFEVNPWPRFPVTGYMSISAVRRWTRSYVNKTYLFDKNSTVSLCDDPPEAEVFSDYKTSQILTQTREAAEALRLATGRIDSSGRRIQSPDTEGQLDAAYACSFLANPSTPSGFEILWSHVVPDGQRERPYTRKNTNYRFPFSTVSCILKRVLSPEKISLESTEHLEVGEARGDGEETEEGEKENVGNSLDSVEIKEEGRG